MTADLAALVVEADRFSGCLVGQAVGDALGFLVEGCPPDECAAYVEQALRPRRLPGEGRDPFEIGQYTDDTQLARELARSLVERGRLDPADYAARVAALFTEDRIVGRGRATASAAYRIARGVPWQDAGAPAPAAGNGSAMRAAPIGLFYRDEPDALIAAVHEQGRITHRDPRCTAGAIAIAGATAIVVGEEEVHAASLCTTLSDWTRPFDPVLAEAIRELPLWIQLPPDRAVKTIAPIGSEPTYTDGWQGISPFVTSSVLWSLYCVLRSPTDYWQVICDAIAVGGDVDTTAAMAGAIAGACVGLGRIPREAAILATDQGTWGFDELVHLGRELHAVSFHRRSGTS